MKLKQLEMTLQRLAGFSRPRPALEQYQTPAPLAARLLYHALMKGDIEGKRVCDLGMRDRGARDRCLAPWGGISNRRRDR